MQNGNLEFYTTNELVDEILKRQTFQGIIIASSEECKQVSWEERHFNIRSNNLTKEEIIIILEQMIEILKATDGNNDVL